MKAKKQIITSWKKHPHECGFHVITKEGNPIFVEDYASSLSINIDDELEQLEIEPLEYGKDYQFDIPEEKKDPNKLDYSHIEKCKISGDSQKIKALLYSIGWSNTNNYHKYKDALIEDVKDEIYRLKSTIEDLTELLKKTKSA